MKKLVETAGAAFLRAFLASLITYGAGLLAAPDLNRTYLLGVTALIASVAAGLHAILAYIPKLTFKQWLPDPYGQWLDTFLYTFAASLAVTLPGVLGAPDFPTVKSLAVAAILGAVNAGVQAVEGLFTVNVKPVEGFGIPSPKGKP